MNRNKQITLVSAIDTLKTAMNNLNFIGDYANMELPEEISENLEITLNYLYYLLKECENFNRCVIGLEQKLPLENKKV